MTRAEIRARSTFVDGAAVGPGQREALAAFPPADPWFLIGDVAKRARSASIPGSVMAVDTPRPDAETRGAACPVRSLSAAGQAVCRSPDFGYSQRYISTTKLEVSDVPDNQPSHDARPLDGPGTRSYKEAARIMRDADIGDVIVVRSDGSVCGIVTDRDLVVRAMAEGADAKRRTVADVCRHSSCRSPRATLSIRRHPSCVNTTSGGFR